MIRGDLLYRPPRGGGQWLVRTVEVADRQIKIYQCLEVSHSEDLLEVITFDPTCCVFETNLGPHSFEIVTPKKILHFISESQEITLTWIRTTRQVISSCVLLQNDPFNIAIAERLQPDSYYEVEFRENRPLGVVLERSNECAVVKMSNFKESGIEAGSILVSVNGTKVDNLSYSETVSYLKQWKPPLALRFRKAPSKSGFLKKYTKEKSLSEVRLWKKRYFVLEAGHLYYRDAESSAIRGDIPLMGSSISILAGPDIGIMSCFRVLSGVTGIILQAESEDHMMDWVTTIYHAMAVANGGGYLEGIHAIAEKIKQPKLAVSQRNDLALDGVDRPVATVFQSKESPLNLRKQDSSSLLSSSSTITPKENINFLRSRENESGSVTSPPSILSDAEETLMIAEIRVKKELISETDALDLSPSKFSAVEESNIEKDVVGSIDPPNKMELSQFSASLSASEVLNDSELDVVCQTKTSIERSSMERETINIDIELSRASEILELLENAAKLRFLAELKFTLNVAFDSGFENRDHIYHAHYLQFRRLEKELEDNDEENEADAEAANFSLQTNVDMNFSDKLVRLEVRSPYSSNIVDGECEEEEEPFDDSISDFTDPFEGRKIARRKSKKYRFLSEIPATEEDLRQLFHVLTKESGSINAIQLSNIWRIITGEKNLFKEMKLFHKFDRKNNGFLAEEDFVHGWLLIASEEPGRKDVLKKLKSFLDEELL